jgi:hypothetical protein
MDRRYEQPDTHLREIDKWASNGIVPFPGIPIRIRGDRPVGSQLISPCAGIRISGTGLLTTIFCPVSPFLWMTPVVMVIGASFAFHPPRVSTKMTAQ